MWQGAESRWYARDDKLIVSHPYGALVLAGWPRCLAWRCDTSGAWEQFRPADPILRTVGTAASPEFVQRAMRRSSDAEQLTESEFERQRAGMTRRHEAAVAFHALFPLDLRAQVARLAERHWPVLSLVARCPGADELYASNPALAFALASSGSLRDRPVARPLRSARALLRKPRTAILEWLGFPPAPWVARVLAKIAPRALTTRNLRYVRTALRDGSVSKAFLHLPRLDLGTLRILTDPELRDLASFTLLTEIDGSMLRSASAAYLLRDAARMHAALDDGRRLPVQRSLRGLERVHNELVARQNHEGNQAMLALDLPPAPIAGNEAIVPLVTPGDILDEGRAMHHCVFSYVPAVAQGSTYIYRVLEPERATLSVVKQADRWQLGQLSGPGNAPVGPDTRAAVAGWLEGIDSCDDAAERWAGDASSL